MGRGCSTVLGTVLVAVVVGGLPSTALAGTVSQSGNTITFVAGPNETNSLVAFDFGNEVIVQDQVPITAGPGCSPDPGGDPGEAVCQNAPGVSINAQLGDGSDFASVISEPGSVNTVDGGPGNDEIRGGSGEAGAVNNFAGGDGDDIIYPDYGFERNPTARDAISGGPGTDTVRYYFHATGVEISLDGQANDGSPGEGDNVAADFEILIGSDLLPNTITGTDGPEELIGGTDDDVLSGGGGADELIGVSGNDELFAGSGDDLLIGNTGDDLLDGGSGFDSFAGDESGGSNQVITGNDTILAADGVEKEPISCGPGSDTVTADRGDVITTDPQNGCEQVKLVKSDGGGIKGVEVKFPKSVKIGGKFAVKTKVATKSKKVKATATGSISLGKKIKLTTASKSIKPKKSATLVQGLAGSKAAKAKAQDLILSALGDGQAVRAVITVKLKAGKDSATVKESVQIK